ncbi:dethiobiotin synthase, partial [Pseudomonas sp. HMWF031]
HADNPRTLEDLGGVPVLAELPPLDPLSAATLSAAWQKQKLGLKFRALMHRPDH